jgi:hypothetical protein
VEEIPEVDGVAATVEALCDGDGGLHKADFRAPFNCGLTTQI